MSAHGTTLARPQTPPPRIIAHEHHRPNLQALRHAISELVRQDGPDLSQRQLAVLMIVGLTPAPHTVRGLAAKLNVAKPAITRAVDRLQELQLVCRKPDPRDKRSVLLSALPDGHRMLAQIDRALREDEGDA